MQIAVIGAGAIGGTIAALLDAVGHSVELTARGEHLARIRESGIRLTGAWGTHVARVTANETLTVRPELAFVCTKAQDARSAISANTDLLRGLPVVIVQNGLEALDTAREALPEADWIGALALYAASYLSPGEISITTPGVTYLGSGPGAPSPATRAVRATLGEVMPTEAIPNFTGAQWSKLIVNQVNAMPAITGLSAQETLEHPALRRIITRSMREAVGIGFARGVHFGKVQGLSDLRLRAFARAPLTLAEQLPLLMRRRMGDTPNPGSTLQSIRRGQLTEIDYLNGAVVKEAAAAGREAPVNAALTALVHEVERTGAFLTPAAVARAVP
ncbi:ketopantoate reductase family protein [Subtercola boreus]|uniref:2-dehydropantoate 2-reductase n=1 Tax=Subtercola boreus TaxID=120213 RepID=A0A3E0WCG9_9MICO|nr:ketopantoate reductase family protein [Subtercola boreus]RFA20240.1 2-dehydropantoate 2-reductase [Subtercola boreus]RFA20392.1 2-dehydropantoate 2-reductase [Subtercola boreus]RFA26644.1 2-dehydropantoate 2-reductase [Subtercola boreus]